MEPFQEVFVVHLNVGIANGGAFMRVPAGKLAVIEHVSVSTTGRTANEADYFVTSTIKDGSTTREVPVVVARAPSGSIIGSHPIRAYGKAGTEFGGVVRRIGNLQEDVFGSFVLAGHYEPA
jgi:hypothetical protein